jgi:hypothetical protein
LLTYQGRYAEEGESGMPPAFVSKITADGQTLLYSTYLGGGGNGAAGDYGTGIAVDANDNAQVAGPTSSNDFPITANAYLSFRNPDAQGSASAPTRTMEKSAAASAIAPVCIRCSTQPHKGRIRPSDRWRRGSGRL